MGGVVVIVSSSGIQIRIYAAGGYLEMGRVNGNLNLSRALGDLVYKSDCTLPPEKQILSGCPDIVCINRDPETDEFLVARTSSTLTVSLSRFRYSRCLSQSPSLSLCGALLVLILERLIVFLLLQIIGCDGIWELLSSSEVVEFVRRRIDVRGTGQHLRCSLTLLFNLIILRVCTFRQSLDVHFFVLLFTPMPVSERAVSIGISRYRIDEDTVRFMMLQ